MMTVKLSHRRGFTLLEVILALALMAVLMSIVGMAVDTYWRAHDRGRKSVENAQLARALLAQIADDLRSTISTPPDYSTACSEMAENLKSSIDQIQAQSQPTGGSQGGGGDQGGGNQGGGGQGGGGTGQGGRGQGGGGRGDDQGGGGGPGGPGGGGGPPNGDPPSGDGSPGNDAGPPQQDPNSGQDSNDGAPGGGRGGDGGTGSGGGRGGVGGGGVGGGGVGGGGTGGGRGGGTGGGGSAGGSSAGGSNSATTGNTVQPTVMEDTSQTTEAPLLVPRMYGSQYDLQIDISRPLRPDQLRVLGTTPPGASTLQYRLEDPQAMGDGRQFADGGGLPTLPQTMANPMLGLVRQESNRILFAAGSTTTRGGQDLSRPDVLAPEVAGLEFRYFDGTNWLSDWDSDTLQSTPKAIEILLTLRVPQSRTGLFSWNAPAENELLEQHRMVVRLPNQIEAPAANATGTSSTGTSSMGTSSTGGVSSGSGGTLSSGTR